MKLWQKIVLYVLLLFIPFLLCFGIIMIENHKKMAVDQVIVQTGNELADISMGLIQYVMEERAKEAAVNTTSDEKFINDYVVNQTNIWGNYLELYHNGKVLYSNFSEELSEVAKNIPISRYMEYRIYKVKHKQYLVYTGYIPLSDNELSFTYFKEIQEIYMETKMQYSFYIKLSLIMILLIAAGTYFIVKYLTKSLRAIMKAVQNIEEGNYTERISLKSRDEIGMLIQSHNRMAEAIEEKISELENKNMEQQRFIDNFTHELKTPLTSVIGYADILRSMDCTEAEVQEVSQNIFKQGKKIEKLYELMMDLSFLNRNQFHLVRCSMGEILLEAKEQFQPLLSKKNIQMIIYIPDNLILVSGDRELLLHLIGNIIDNAQKASAEGSFIWLRGCTQGEQVLIEIEDKGCGIPAEDQSRIFERFFMVDKVRSGKTKGVGLGLSICADIVKIHHAQIEVCSKEKEGTIVKIYFPCYKDDTKKC